MPAFKSLSKLFFILAAISLIYGGRVFVEGQTDFRAFVPLRGELIFFIAIVLSVGYFFWPPHLAEFTFIRRDIYLALMWSLFCIYVASAISYFRYDLGFTVQTAVLLVKLGLNVSIFLFIYIYSLKDRVFFRNTCLALVLPPLLILPALLLPPETLGFAALYLSRELDVVSASLTTNQGQPIGFTSWDRFSGLTLNPIHMGYINLVSLSFLCPLLFYSFFRRRWLKTCVVLLLVVGLIALNYWTLARSIMIATLFVALLSAVMVGHYFKQHVLIIGGFAISALVGAVLLFFLLPEWMQEGFVNRLSAAQLSGARTAIWWQYLDLIPDNPFGLGLSFEQKFLVLDSDGNQVPPHSFPLELWAFGGVGLAIGFVYLLWRALASVRKYARQVDDQFFIYSVGIEIALYGLLAAAMFTGALFFIHFWILLALALGYPRVAKSEAREDIESRKLNV